MNRSTIYDFLVKETDLKYTFTYISGGKYVVFPVPYDWDHSYLMINSMRVTDFQSIILFTNELVVRFDVRGTEQINIPYKDIEYLEVMEDMDIHYIGLHEGKKVYH